MIKVVLFMFISFILFTSCDPNKVEESGCRDYCTAEYMKCDQYDTCVVKEDRCENRRDCLDDETCNRKTHYCEPKDLTCDNLTCNKVHQECQMIDGRGKCVCESGYTLDGESCIESIITCEDLTCDKPHQECQTVDEVAKCVCESGYTLDGESCIEEISCDLVCGNNEICIFDEENNQECICADGFYLKDESCVENPTCATVICGNNEHCIVDSDTHTTPCVCDDGFHKEENICVETTSCTDKVCQTNEECKIKDGEPICECIENYFLQNGACVTDCSHTTCGNNETCIMENTLPKCICDENSHLEEGACVLNPTCDGVICTDNGHCILENDAPVCVCDNLYHFEGEQCVLTETCTLVCENNEHCELREGTETCVCDEGFQDNDNSGLCTDACSDNSCLHGSCNDSTGSIICSCDDGWSGTTCDISSDVCLSTCGENATCETNLDETIRCICNDGYQDNDGDNICKISCEGAGNCSGHGDCDDSNGEVYCICTEGFQDKDHNGTCTPKCSLNSCGDNGVCDDATGSIVCSCDPGFTEVNGECISPCEGITCGNKGECRVDNDGDTYCNCNDGYQDDDGDLICKTSCAALDNCGTSGTCSYVNGEATCSCNDSYQDNDNDGSCMPVCDLALCSDDKYVTPASCDDSSGFPVCEYKSGYNWTYTFGGINMDSVNDSIIDSYGNIYLTGSFSETVDFDPTSVEDNRSSNGGTDIFLVRINADGTYGWTYNVGGNDNDVSYGVALDNDNNPIITGTFSRNVDFNNSVNTYYGTSLGRSDIFVVKVSKRGTFQWLYTAGGNMYDEGRAITSDSTGLYITGTFDQTVQFNNEDNNSIFTTNGGLDIFITKLNFNGSYGWTKTFGGTGYEEVNSIAINSNKLLVSGKFRGTVDFDTQNDGGELSNNNDDQNTFIVSFDNNGIFSWVKSLEGGDSTTNKIKFDSTGNIFLGGKFAGTVDFDPSSGVNSSSATGFGNAFLLKLDNNGNYIWKYILTSSGESLINSFDFNNGNIYLSGAFSGNSTLGNSTESFLTDAFLIKVNSTGSLDSTFNKVFGSTGMDSGKNIVIKSDILYFLGQFNETIDFDKGSSVDNKTSNGTTDVFISRYKLN